MICVGGGDNSHTTAIGESPNKQQQHLLFEQSVGLKANIAYGAG